MNRAVKNMSTTPAQGPQAATYFGLTEQEAAQRLQTEGFNELPSARPRSLLRTAAEVLREPMFLLLLATGTVYVLLGDPREAAAIMLAVVVVIGITLHQERKTERALQALRDLSSPRALVIRDGKRRRIAGRDVVRGDLVVLSEGDRVPADSLLLEERNLSVDESLLTGESIPVAKKAETAQGQSARPGGDDLPFVFSGTMVVRGRGIAEVRATGVHTEIGRIGKALQGLQPEDTHLQKETSRIVRIFAVAGLVLCLVVAAVYGFTRADLLNGILVGLTLAISMVPEEFPVVLTIFLALGAWRISRQRVLTRRMPAIETLGSATVLCVDKTGTLTLNRMSVQALFASGEEYRLEPGSEIPNHLHEVVEYSILASSRDPFDPMEKAFVDLGNTALGGSEHLHPDWTLEREYPLSPELLVMSRSWKAADSAAHLIAAKGAPEAVAELCRLPRNDAEQIRSATTRMAAQGLRVLGVAKAETRGPLPASQFGLPFRFVGLVGLADPLRPSVPAAVQECYRAGVRVVMITGDYPVTAQNIAHQAGLTVNAHTITGPELEKMTQEELQSRVRDVNIFARVVPEQKLRLVQALQANGEVVAMTGDGVNDAPALKAADIGIAMGQRGTDVARESAALVLLDDDFSSIVNAIRLGRRIYDNLKKATAYVLAVHVPIAGVTLIPVLLGWPLILMPVHVLFLELIIDPTCSVAFEAEPEEDDVMKRRPRNPRERLFAPKRVGISLLQGLTVLATVLVVYAVAMRMGHDEVDCRALAFSTLIVGNLSLIFANRSWSRTIWQTLRSPNRALWWVTAAALATLAVIIYVPLLRTVFHFSMLHPLDVMVAAAAGFAGVLWFEVMKLLGAGFFRGIRERWVS
jgi:Ca2+-transporting ATPase